jgi:dynein heavy chain 1
VEEMQKSLAVKSQELQAKNEAANAKLKQMFKDQQEAEKKKVQSQEIQQQLAEQTVKIEEKRKDVMADLALVEPAVIDAQAGTFFLVHFKVCRVYFQFHIVFAFKL